MNQIIKVLLLIGSPKGEKSTSNGISSYLFKKFKENGVKAKKTYIIKAIRTKTGVHELKSLVYDSDIIILVSPLYIDSIPAITVKVMEEIYEHKNDTFRKKQMFMAIFNSGFPEPHQNDLAIDMCKKFASDTGMEWAGSVTIGMGSSLEGKALEKLGMAKNLRNGLDTAVKSLIAGKSVPEEAEIIASKPLMPLTIAKFVMNTFGGILWRNRMNKNAKKKVYNRPYA